MSDPIEQATVILLAAVSIAVGATEMRPVNQPEPQPVEQAQLTLTGAASWYDYVPGGAAAGPKLRQMLGPDWRDQTVQVCVETQTCTTVTLSDWCQCYWKQERERIIDLDDRSFAKLTDLSAGLVKVTVSAE